MAIVNVHFTSKLKNNKVFNKLDSQDLEAQQANYTLIKGLISCAMT